MLNHLVNAYRRTGADIPFGNPLPSHGTEMEGWFWRVSDEASGRVLIALCSVNRHPDGDWSTTAVGVHPGLVVRSAALAGAYVNAGLGIDAMVSADGGQLVVRSEYGALRLALSWIERDLLMAMPADAPRRGAGKPWAAVVRVQGDGLVISTDRTKNLRLARAG